MEVGNDYFVIFLCLHLIKQNEVDIYDIPIARITQQYLEYIQLMEKLDLEVAGEFILMAATLIRIKARMLLPPVPGEEEDPRSELVLALLEHQRYQEAALDLVALENKQSLYHPRVDFGYLPLPEPVLDQIGGDFIGEGRGGQWFVEGILRGHRLQRHNH